jgi:dephospho-CoA kinase
MKIIGITGGIGSGKTTVTEFLKAKGYHVVDADMVAREIVEPGTAVLGELVSHFGESILQKDGSLNRKRLAELAFANSSEKNELDRITHGAILENITQQIEQLKMKQHTDLVFVDAALMIETGLYKKMDEVWLVTANETLRVKRVEARDRIDEAIVRQRIRSQLSDEQKARHAFRIINNSGTKEELYNIMEQILRNYETV